MGSGGEVSGLERVVFMGQGSLVTRLTKPWNQAVRKLIKRIPQIEVGWV